MTLQPRLLDRRADMFHIAPSAGPHEHYSRIGCELVFGNRASLRVAGVASSSWLPGDRWDVWFVRVLGVDWHVEHAAPGLLVEPLPRLGRRTVRVVGFDLLHDRNDLLSQKSRDRDQASGPDALPWM